jgi:hypothetical protein
MPDDAQPDDGPDMTDLELLTEKIKAVLTADGFEVEGGALTHVGNVTAKKDGEVLQVRLTLGEIKPREP